MSVVVECSISRSSVVVDIRCGSGAKEAKTTFLRGGGVLGATPTSYDSKDVRNGFSMAIIVRNERRLIFKTLVWWNKIICWKMNIISVRKIDVGMMWFLGSCQADN